MASQPFPEHPDAELHSFVVVFGALPHLLQHFGCAFDSLGEVESGGVLEQGEADNRYIWSGLDEFSDHLDVAFVGQEERRKDWVPDFES